MRKLLPKTTRLKSRKDISFIFLKGKSVFVHPIKANYSINSDEKSPQLVFGISVSKRNFSKAVDRNRIKRLLREAIRLNKSELEIELNAKNIKLKCMFAYIGKQMPDFALINEKIILTLRQLKTINEPSS